MHCFYLLPSIELIQILNNSLLHLHLNDIKRRNSSSLEKVLTINIVKKNPQIKSECNRLTRF